MSVQNIFWPENLLLYFVTKEKKRKEEGVYVTVSGRLYGP